MHFQDPLFLNLVASSLALALSAVFWLSHRRAPREYGSETIGSFATYATGAWIGALALWVCLYGVLYYRCSLFGVLDTTALSLFLSNLNSVALLLLFYFVSRGDDAVANPGVPRALAVVGLGGSIVIDSTLIGLARFIAPLDSSALFLRPWSITLSMCAPVLVGRAFKNRYASNTIWAVALFYALMQPVAYGVEPLVPERESVSIAVPRSRLGDVQSGLQQLGVTTILRDSTSAIATIDTSALPGTRSQVRSEVLGAIGSLGLPPYVVLQAEIQMGIVPIVFSLLAVLKLAFGGLVIMRLGAIPASGANTVTSFPQIPDCYTADRVRGVVSTAMMFLAGSVAVALVSPYGRDLTALRVVSVFLAVVASAAVYGSLFGTISDIVSAEGARAVRRWVFLALAVGTGVVVLLSEGASDSDWPITAASGVAVGSLVVALYAYGRTDRVRLRLIHMQRSRREFEERERTLRSIRQMLAHQSQAKDHAARDKSGAN